MTTYWLGPLQARLEELAGGGGLKEDLLGLCVGAFGDISTDLDRLIKALAESRALYLSREAGRPLSDNEAGQILGQYRRVLSVTFVRSQAACLVARVGHLGQAARECAGRRSVAMAEGVRMRRQQPTTLPTSGGGGAGALVNRSGCTIGL